MLLYLKRNGPIYVRKSESRLEPVWVHSVLRRQVEGGTLFFLRCYDANDIDRKPGSLPQKVYVINYQDIYREKGKRIVDRQYHPDAKSGHRQAGKSVFLTGYKAGGRSRDPR